MKFSFYATTLLLLNGLSGSHARMGSRSLEEDDNTSVLMQLLGAVLGPILEAFPFIEDIPILGDIVGDIYADSLTYDEIIAQVLSDFGYTEIPDPYCNVTREEPEDSLATICNPDGKLTWIDLRDNYPDDGKPPSSGFISTFIGKLPELIGLSSTTFYEDHLNYGTLPTEIGQLTQLTYLGFYNSGLTGAVPSEISSLEQLKYLQLAGNLDLTGSIPSGLENLIGLMVTSTGISDFDDAYCDIDQIDYGNSEVPVDKCP